ncbi:MAG: WD40/YVTN/BNR-like repeat-containing protein, partial [Stellaceae bacterium]
MLRTRQAAAALLLLAPGLLGAQTQQAAPQQIATGSYGHLHWRTIGPEGNRFSAVAGIPGDPQTYYVGAASGGIWKTIDGGVHWKPVFDDQLVQSIGSLAIAPSDPKIVWAGTGEGNIRSHISIGQGVYKSVDAGKSWKLMGLEKTGRIPRMVIDPRDPNTVLACALGTAYGP